MKSGNLRWKGVVLGLATLLSVAGLVSTAFARHGEENLLTNRIPEPASYVVAETTSAGGAFGAPHTGVPFEPLWTGDNNSGGCDGCHTGLWEQWNGAMMSNAWRDPGWRGAFLLVARLTSTDGCNDIPAPPDDTQRMDCVTINPVTEQPYRINPFANADGTSTFDMGTGNVTYSGSGSLMDDFCSRCHMPTNYIDGTTNVYADNQSPYGGGTSTQEHGRISPFYDPTAVGTAQATDPANSQLTLESFGPRTYVDGVSRVVNSNSGKAGIICEVCHTNVESRYTPYHLYNKTSTSGIAEYYPATQDVGRSEAGNGLEKYQQDMLTPPDTTSGNLGYAVGAGAFRLSPHALNLPERFGPLSWNDPCSAGFILNPNGNGTPNPNFPNPYGYTCAGGLAVDPYVTDVFTGGTRTGLQYDIHFTQADPPGAHDTFYQVKFERAEFCASCHDVTNPMTIKNQFGYWVGGFPIERTYTEWKNSRYSDRPGNTYHDANYKRDCETCHMQQSYDEPGTALTLYTVDGSMVTPDGPILEPSCDQITHNPGYSHHFVGGNGYMTRLIGADITGGGNVQPYPELLHTSFSSADPNSRYHYARYDTAGTVTGGTTQHERFAWDRLRNALTMSVTAPASVSRPTSGTSLAGPLIIAVKNEGSGHNFPTGFPEGRAAWVAVRAFDANGVELEIQDSVNGNRRSFGVGYLTTGSTKPDPTYPSSCPDAESHPGGWKIPEGAIDPYAYTFRAMATLDKNCPTLDLPYATPVNLVVDDNPASPNFNMPIDSSGVVIDRDNPNGIPQYTDNPNNPNGDVFDDSFLRDTRLQPCRKVGTVSCGNAGAMVSLDRYSVVVTPTTVGPIGVTAAVYYQSFEAIVAKKFLGNLADTDDDAVPTLEPCVLKAPCGRATNDATYRQALLFDPVVVEGAPPVPAEVRNAVIQVTQTTDNVAPRVVINNCKPPRKNNVCPGTNLTNPSIPANNHWSPSPYGGQTGNYATEGYGELAVAQTRIVKVSFSEPVQECDDVPDPGLVNCGPLKENTFYLTDNANGALTFLQDQIGDTTWGLFPYVQNDSTFLSGGGHIIHVARIRNNRAIKDYAGNTLFPGPAANGEYTFGFKAQ